MKQSKLFMVLAGLLLALCVGLPEHDACAKDPSIKALTGQYQQTKEKEKQKEILIQLGKTEPTTQDDVAQLRQIFSKKDWDESLYASAVESLKRIKDSSLDISLIEILKDEKEFADKAAQGGSTGQSEREANYRLKNIMFIIEKLGELKSQKSVSILKEYLSNKAFQFYASEALAKIGDKSASEEIRERAYKGESVNYGGLGLDEALNVINGLKDKTKADKWPKMAKQIILIKDPKAKPYLKALFNHEKDYVREESASAYSVLVNESDIATIEEMAKNQDWFVRSRAIDAMKNIPQESFAGTLIDLLINDPHRSPRSNAAKALGYKKVTSAIPYLEKALNDKELRVRQESFIALYILTGNKYDFKGRNAAIDQQAENQKKNPTVH